MSYEDKKREYEERKLQAEKQALADGPQVVVTPTHDVEQTVALTDAGDDADLDQLIKGVLLGSGSTVTVGGLTRLAIWIRDTYFLKKQVQAGAEALRDATAAAVEHNATNLTNALREGRVRGVAAAVQEAAFAPLYAGEQAMNAWNAAGAGTGADHVVGMDLSHALGVVDQRTSLRLRAANTISRILPVDVPGRVADSVGRVLDSVGVTEGSTARQFFASLLDARTAQPREFTVEPLTTAPTVQSTSEDVVLEDAVDQNDYHATEEDDGVFEDAVEDVAGVEDVTHPTPADDILPSENVPEGVYPRSLTREELHESLNGPRTATSRVQRMSRIGQAVDRGALNIANATTRNVQRASTRVIGQGATRVVGSGAKAVGKTALKALTYGRGVPFAAALEGVVAAISIRQGDVQLSEQQRAYAQAVADGTMTQADAEILSMIAEDRTNVNRGGSIGGAIGGAGVGLAAGAAAGSVIPIVGNVIGGIFGLVAGAAGGMAGSWAGGQVGQSVATQADTDYRNNINYRIQTRLREQIQNHEVNLTSTITARPEVQEWLRGHNDWWYRFDQHLQLEEVRNHPQLYSDKPVWNMRNFNPWV